MKASRYNKINKEGRNREVEEETKEEGEKRENVYVAFTEVLSSMTAEVQL
jgi:hypothetical protein